MPRTAVYALLLLLGSALWSFFPPLVSLTTGWGMGGAGGGNNFDFSSWWVQAALLLFMASGWFLLWGHRLLGKASQDEVRLAAGFSILFLYLGYNLQRFEAELLLMSHRNAFPFEGAVWVYLAAGMAYLVFLLRPPRQSAWILGVTLAFLLALVPFSVRSFPFENGFSDIFLDIEAAGRSLLHGRSPYELQLSLGPERRCNYLPGLWLSFLPAVAVNLDPRFLAALYGAAFAFVVWRGMGAPHRALATWFLVLFLLNPWALLRQDTYIPAYLLGWGFFFLALRRGRDSWAAWCYGLGLSMHPFHWALLPVWLAWLFRRGGRGEAGKRLLQALGVAAVLILPFIAWDSRGFLEGAVFHFMEKKVAVISHFGLVVWLGAWPGWLAVLALVFLGVGAWGAWRGAATLESLFRWLSLSLGVALLSSYHVEHYYYFVPLALLLFHEITLREGEGIVDPKMKKLRT